MAPPRIDDDAEKKMSNPSLTAADLTEVVSRLRELWKDCDEAPAVRSACHDLSLALVAKDPGFDQETFWRACGYQVRGAEGE